MIQFIDGFAHYTSSNIPQKWTFPDGTITQTPPAGRLGPGINQGGEMAVTLPHESGWVTGFAAYFTASGHSGFIYSGAHAGFPGVLSLRIESDNTLSLYVANNGVLVANSSPFAVFENTWYYFQIKYTISGGTATPVVVTATCLVDGTNRVSGSGTSASNTTGYLLRTPTVNYHKFSNTVVNGRTFFKDLYIFDTTGGHTNDFAGDCTFIYVVPDGDVTTQWTPSSGTVHFSLVNEVPPDGDSSYVQSTGTNNLDNYTWQDIPVFSGTIVAAQYLGFLRKTGEGQRSVKLTVGTGSFDQTSDEFFLNDNYLYYRLPLGTDPATGAQWTQSGFNATKFGVKQIS